MEKYNVIFCDCSKAYYSLVGFKKHKLTSKHITYFMDLEEKNKILKESYC